LKKNVDYFASLQPQFEIKLSQLGDAVKDLTDRPDADEDWLHLHRLICEHMQLIQGAVRRLNACSFKIVDAYCLGDLIVASNA
jgi:hypothetical protein